MLVLETNRLFVKQLGAEQAAAVAQFKLSHREAIRAREPHRLERLNFQKEGLAKDYLLINGRWEHMVLTSLVNSSWKALEG